MIASQALTVGATLGVAGFQLIESVDRNSTTGGVIGQLGVIGAGVAVFLYQERRRKAEQDALNEQRRESDRIKDARIAELETRNASLVDRMLGEEHP